MDIFGKAKRLESKLTRTFDGAAQQLTRSGPRTPLEILHAIVDGVEQAREPAGRGAHVFPFNRVKVSIVAPSRDARARLAALFEADPTLEARVAARLREAGCDGTSLQIKITYVDRAAPGWLAPDMHIDFDRVAEVGQSRERPSGPPTVRIAIAHGTADKPSYTFALGRINLGRGAEVRDSRNQLIRSNHVAFAEDASAPNSSVSRRHAHIEYATELGHYRICDDGSVHGTGIVRSGRTVRVPAGTRGIRVFSGDEVLIGEARLRVRIDEA
jgi:hypothetical protein